ncbi:MAG TPA: M48 family metalloprotease [Candidatus Binatia bacterium]|nr:M48 family metalloprotease [Candidatus Binatia bacterium]
MAGDFKFEKGASFGDWLHKEMREAVHFETEAWAIDRARRVEDRLQAGRPKAERLVVEIPWLDVATAFTAPGRYIYFSRRLYERCPTDDEVALVVAHEIAHHDLGHIKIFARWVDKIVRLPGATLFAFAFHAIERRLYGPEKECDADRYGLDMCLAAGYDAQRALELFDVLEQHALDMGDHDIVYGPDEESDDELDEDASWTTKAQIWAWQRKRGYLPIRDRRQMLLKHLQRNAPNRTKPST